MISALDPVRQICSALYGVSQDLSAKVLEAIWSSPDLPLVRLNSNKHICDVNAAAEIMLNQTSESLVGQTLRGLFPDLGVEANEKCYTEGDCLYCSVDGERMRIILVPKPLGQARECYAIFQPMLSREARGIVDSDIRICEETESILGLAYDLVTVTDGQGKGLRASSTLEMLFGTPLENFVGHSVQELVKKGVLSQSVTMHVLRNRSTRTLVQQTKNNRSLVVTGVPVTDSLGRIVQVVNFTRDITNMDSLQRRIWEARTLLETYQREINVNRRFISPGSGLSSWQRLAERAALVDSTVLISGESGVGKEVVARGIHNVSNRCRGPFIKINCAAIPESLFESELFGHERGAFTGANEKGEGLILQAKGGTLVLDEISELPKPMQAKLLHLLQDKEYVPVGGTKTVKVDIRVIAITNRGLPTLVEEGAFRRDLFYRLHVLTIHVPPLRQRTDEIPGLVTKFLDRQNEALNRKVFFEREAIDLMMDYTWPGNVRELENFVERMVVISEEDKITGEVVSQQLIKNDAPKIKEVSVEKIMPLKDAIEMLERELLAKVCNNKRSTRDIGKLLGIDQSTVVRKMKRYGYAKRPHSQ